MVAMASQITSLTIVYSTVYSGADERKHQRSASLALVWGIRPVNSPHKWPVSRKMFPFDDVIMYREECIIVGKGCHNLSGLVGAITLFPGRSSDTHYVLYCYSLSGENHSQNTSHDLSYCYIAYVTTLRNVALFNGYSFHIYEKETHLRKLLWCNIWCNW